MSGENKGENQNTKKNGYDVIIIEEFCRLVSASASSGTLKKAVFSRPSAPKNETALRINVTPFGPYSGAATKIAVESFYQDGRTLRDNIKAENLYERALALAAKFRQANLITEAEQYQLMVSKKGKATLICSKTQTASNSDSKNDDAANSHESQNSHNRQKKYIFDGTELFLRELGISSAEGRVHDKKQSKFRQINRFTELLDDVYDKLPSSGTLNVCDLCCGKSYLSFAVYEYLSTVRGRDVKMLCVDKKQNVIEYCDDVAKRTGADGMTFVCSDINDSSVYENAFGDSTIHLVVSLRACDTATDAVLRRAAAMGARVILSTPCCHHELNGKINCEALSFITRRSMTSQRLTETVTDSLRALMLEIESYRTDIVELIDPDETPKNLLIRAVKRRRGAIMNNDKIDEYNKIIDFLGLHGSFYDIYKSRGDKIE